MISYHLQIIIKQIFFVESFEPFFKKQSQDLQHLKGPFARFLHDDITESVLTIILAGEWICSFLHLLDTEDVFSDHVSAQMHHVRYFSQIAVAMLVCDMGLIFVSYGPTKFLTKKHNVFYLVYTVLTAFLESYVMPNAGSDGYLQAEFPATTIHRIMVARRIWNFTRPLLMGYFIEQLFSRVAGPVHEHVMWRLPFPHLGARDDPKKM